MQRTQIQARFRVRRAVWPSDAPAGMRIRKAVFVHELGVPPELEWDTRDPIALHLLADDGNSQPLGTARLLPDGQIGRMAVLARCRRWGIGSALLDTLIQTARSGRYPGLWLNAQNSAIPFYRRHGFRVQGSLFEEAGIPHRKMILASPTEA